MKALEQKDLCVSVRRKTIYIAYHDPLINDKRITASDFVVLLFSNKNRPPID